MFELRQVAGSKRVIRLLRPTAAPLAPASWGVRQRGPVRWAYGSNTGSAIFGGSEELPTEFTFAWRTRSLTDQSAELVGSGAITNADDLVDLFRDIVRERSPVFVRWRHREALAKLDEFVAEEGRLGEYDPVTLTVQWLGPDAVPREARPKPTRPVRDTVRAVTTAYAQGLGEARVPLTMAREFRTDFEVALTDVTRSLTATAELVGAYRGRGAAAPQLAGSVAGRLRDVVTKAAALTTSVGYSAGALALVDGSAELANAAFFRATVQRSALAARRQAELGRITLEAIATGEILGVVQAAAGLDLRVVALDYYGDAEKWPQIAAFNGLASSVLEAGQRVKVPRDGLAL